MKVLVCHEFYRQFGGEDQSFLDEVSLLRSKGHTVVEYTRHYDEIRRNSRIGTAVRSVWNAAAYRELRTVIRRERPDIVHCTNLFPLISPAAYKAAHDEDVPVVQALRNYRFVCPSATLTRDGGVCESCLHKVVPVAGRATWLLPGKPSGQCCCGHDARHSQPQADMAAGRLLLYAESFCPQPVHTRRHAGRAD